MDDSTQPEDLIDVLIGSVPRHLWVTIGVVAVMLLISWLFFIVPPQQSAEGANPNSDALEGRVVEILAEEGVGDGSGAQPVQRVLVEVTSGSQRGQRVEADHGTATLLLEHNRVRPGDRILLERVSTDAGERYYITDFTRLPSLLLLIILFAVAALVVGKAVGLRALMSVGVNVLAIGGFIIPGILSGHNPLLVCLAGSLFLMTASLYLIYQWTWKTHVALVGLGMSLAVTAGLAILFANTGHLTGLGSESAGFLVQTMHVEIDLRGLLLGSILLGAVGVLDDITIGQASATFELRRANPALGWRPLYTHAMTIGRDHIASMINTLLLAYVGAALPLFLLIASLDLPIVQTLNREMIAEEIVRTLVGSIGLILAVPATSLIAAVAAQKWAPVESGESSLAAQPGEQPETVSGESGDLASGL